MLKTRQLNCIRGDHLLVRSLDLSLQAGEILQVLGENGSGKSTFLRVLAGLMPYESGDICWNYTSIVRAQSAYQREVCYLGHQLGVKYHLTVLENILLGWRFCDKSKVVSMLAHLKLSDYQHRLCRYLSRGQKQRVALAMLFLSNASLWILDEPFSSLDQWGMEYLKIQLLEKLHAGGSIICATHDRLTWQDVPLKTLCLPYLAQ